MQSKPVILFDNKIPFLDKDILGDNHQLFEWKEFEADKLKEICSQDFDALLVRSINSVNEKSTGKNPRFKFCYSLTAGLDHIDQRYLKQNHIHFSNAKGANANSVKEYVFSSLLLTNPEFFKIPEAKTVGIIGFGNVGSLVADTFSKLGFKCCIYDPPLALKSNFKSCSLEDLYSCDLITLHCDLKTGRKHSSLHLINEEFFSKLKKPITLINTSRGEVIEEDSLKRALKEGSVDKLILDVFSNEPQIDFELVGLCELATPHIAGYSLDAKKNLSLMAFKNLLNFFYEDLKKYAIKKEAKEKLIKTAIPVSSNEDLKKVILTSKDLININLKNKFSPYKKEISEIFLEARNNYPLMPEFISQEKFPEVSKDQYFHSVIEQLWKI